MDRLPPRAIRDSPSAICSLTMVLCCIVVPVMAPSAGENQQPTRLRLVFTTDTLGYLEPCG